MNLFKKNMRDFSEEYLKNKKKDELRFWILIWILFILVYLVTLSFISGVLASNKFDDFNGIVSLLASGLLSLVSGIIGFYYGIEVGKKDKKEPQIEDKK